jgi:hypothetical protein
MSEWVIIDITAFTKTTTKEKVIKILKEGGVKVCKVTDPYHSELRNKPTISCTILRADYEAKSPDYPGSWIIEEQYGTEPEVCDPL